MTGVARVLSLDLGSKRIGVASSDLTRTLASPVSVVLRGRSHRDDHDAIARIVDEYEPDAIVVGLPVGLDGKEGQAAALIRTEVAQLALRFTVSIILHDERFTTATAHRALQERNMKARERRHVVDKVAAAVLLQSWLDAQADARQPVSDSVARNLGETCEHAPRAAPDFSGRSGRRAGR